MELILRQDVENLGFKDDVVTVKNGYGRNSLIPKGYAILATSSAKKVLAENLKQRAFKEAKLVEEATAVAEAIKGYEIKITSKVGSGDKLFGSVNNINVAEALAKAGTVIDKKFIKVTGGSVKRLGKYNAAVRLHRAVVADIVFEVVAEK
ncbi:50S ribosomal protein L9 [Tenacibaculum finnmarkense]|uniref:Large ribosomal subunit protein bL9 n=1 Tax=Tenacibaculum finnmarkense genomovar ulcerans TaxID=2781388 RepID=A0A2I2MBQ5_9FLAO|nr:50S ribosomal protein L9 [Tenacibaculum finnmarkense]MBE7634620.1 50S ribosomal protein L9 [Tenacibaculum finnmarkense genomovar ulcerans]MBE7646523.1 50S ribosomal protein L9 [Tenacibaculum finnmarkense genomovar ulcerans]MBE7648702.1 50S ribosomal protein L9 [Tenacibaculum finnmarkense genomovar ulcerans]MBE7687342.1 50S ribosomal protein L9 [Tenacibaculum finnmarkense genomovar ulcerans]MBE7698470.1 50S ribosomal protein L9 [Tenacibaculum finnmarkense genomovar ulcerans]